MKAPFFSARKTNIKKDPKTNLSQGIWGEHGSLRLAKDSPDISLFSMTAIPFNEEAIQKLNSYE